MAFIYYTISCNEFQEQSFSVKFLKTWFCLRAWGFGCGMELKWWLQYLWYTVWLNIWKAAKYVFMALVWWDFIVTCLLFLVLCCGFNFVSHPVSLMGSKHIKAYKFVTAFNPGTNQIFLAFQQHLRLRSCCQLQRTGARKAGRTSTPTHKSIFCQPSTLYCS